MRVLSVLVKSNLVHNEERDVNISLQPRHTCVNAIESRSMRYPSWSGMISKRISGGIRFMGASEFFMDRTNLSTSNATCSREST